MTRLPRAITETSSEDAEAELNSFANGDWSPIRLQSIPSIPFSEYSHPPYEDQSVCLSSAWSATPCKEDAKSSPNPFSRRRSTPLRAVKSCLADSTVTNGNHKETPNLPDVSSPRPSLQSGSRFIPRVSDNASPSTAAVSMRRFQRAAWAGGNGDDKTRSEEWKNDADHRLPPLAPSPRAARRASHRRSLTVFAIPDETTNGEDAETKDDMSPERGATHTGTGTHTAAFCAITSGNEAEMTGGAKPEQPETPTASPSTKWMPSKSAMVPRNASLTEAAEPSVRPSASSGPLGAKKDVLPCPPLPDRLVRAVEAIKDAEILTIVRDYAERPRPGRDLHALAVLCEELLHQREVIAMDAAEPLCSPLHPHPGSGIYSTTQKTKNSPLHDPAPDEDDGDDEDEFDDYNIRMMRFPEEDPRGRFSFAQPSVSGTSTSVFETGMLYRVVTEREAHHFFNDTVQHVMMVRLRCRLNGDEELGETVVSAPLGGGETELTLAVLPEETKFLLRGLSPVPRVLAKGVRPPADFIAPSVTQTLNEVAAAIEAVRARLGRWQRAGDQRTFLRCCVTHGLRFTDLDFRPSNVSLRRPGLDAARVPPLPWRRPSHFLPITEVSEARLFRCVIDCHLVRRGALEDLTVVAGIAAVAMAPRHVRWMFRHPLSATVGKRERAVGAYRVTLAVAGWWRTLLLDDYLPASLKAPLFARCPVDPRRLWVPLLEKAYAKAVGSYAALCAADALEVLSDFTGFPCRQLDEVWAAAALRPETGQSLFRYIHTAARRGLVIMVYTPAASQPGAASSIDISRRLSMRFGASAEGAPLFLPGRAYFITEAAYYEDLDLRVVRLRNPWVCESGRPSGAEWKRSKWSLQPKPGDALTDGAVEAGGEQVGTMWLEWSEALQAFSGGGVCYTLWDWSDCRVAGSFRRNVPDTVLEVRVRVRAECVITVSQTARVADRDEVRPQRGRDKKRPEECEGTAKAEEGEEHLAASGYEAVLLLVSRHSAAQRTESITFRSSGDIEEWSGKLSYHMARDVSLKCSLDPKFNPYYIIPRILDQSGREEVPYVVSLLANGGLGKGEMEVCFRQLDSTCQVFKDVPSFTVNEQNCKPVTASYQIRKTEGILSSTGTFVET